MDYVRLQLVGVSSGLDFFFFTHPIDAQMYWDAWSFGAESKVVLWLLVTGGFHAQVVQQCWFIWLVPEEHAAQG